jgi:hypothetical protein
MFLTAAAQNLLCMKLAAEMGVIVPNAWVTWVKVSHSGSDPLNAANVAAGNAAALCRWQRLPLDIKLPPAA